MAESSNAAAGRTTYPTTLFVIRSLDRGGAERQLVNLVIGMKERGVPVHVAVFYTGGALEKELTESGVKIHNLQKKGTYDLWGLNRRLRALVRELQPGVVHGYLPLSNLLVAIASRRVLTGKRVWGIRCSGITQQPLNRLERILYWSEKHFGSRTDIVITNSESGADEMVSKGLPREKVFAVPNGIDGDRFCINVSAGRSFRSSVGIPLDVPMFGMVGRQDQFKNHQLAIRALARMANKDARLLCVGRIVLASHTQHLKDLALAEGVGERVIWLEEIPDTLPVYNALNSLLSVSLAEGSPNVVAEAMLCGVPCVVTDVGDSAKLVGDLGEVVKSFEPESLAQAMDRILERATIGGAPYTERLRESVLSRFTTDQLVERTMAILYSGCSG